MYRKLIITMTMIFLAVCVAFAGSFSCDITSSVTGKIIADSGSESTIDLGTILWADGNSGKSTVVKLPLNFDCTATYDCPSSHLWSKNAIRTPWGNFNVKFTARVAGVKTLGIWRSKMNDLKLEVRQGSASGPLLVAYNYAQQVSSPKTITGSTAIYRPWVGPGDSRMYTILIKFDKFDSDGGDDGQCGMQMTVIGAAVGPQGESERK
ncbi:MAG: hypothetical protein AB1757_17365 [Acidobacteriota bacterium]